MRFQLQARTGYPDFLDLPWTERLEDWTCDRLVEVPRGLHRHVVRTVEYGDRRFFLKALPPRLAEREWRFLKHLKAEGVPVVDVVGVVRDRHDPDGGELPSVLITAQLEYALPYRLLFARSQARRLREPMLDALAHLLVRIHLVGFMWGDCSLSNTLFRRDASRLSAYLVDTETGELHEGGLSDGQRMHDLDLATERIGGELMDLVAAGLVPDTVDVLELAADLRRRYEDLWDALTQEEELEHDEHYRIHERLRRINELGYDVEEVEVEAGHDGRYRLRLRSAVIEPGRNRRRLRELTGLDVQEHQARSLLHDIDSFGAWLRQHDGVDHTPETVARRWLEHSFHGVVSLVPDHLRGRRDEAQIFHEALRFWWSESGRLGRDLDLFDATRRFVDEVLAVAPDERSIAVETEAERTLLEES